MAVYLLPGANQLEASKTKVEKRRHVAPRGLTLATADEA